MLLQLKKKYKIISIHCKKYCSFRQGFPMKKTLVFSKKKEMDMLIMKQIRLLMMVSVIWSTVTLLSKESHRPPSSCQTKQDEQQWYHYLSKHFSEVFPQGNRNFGGYKWFQFCEHKFWDESGTLGEKNKAKMACCTQSYCPYSGAIAGGAARSKNQKLLTYCINENDALSVCCKPCVCHLGNEKNKTAPNRYKIGAYKNLERVLFEKIEGEFRPITVLQSCKNKNSILFDRHLDKTFYRSCTPNSHDPMGRAKRHSAEKSSKFNQLDLYKKHKKIVQRLLQERCQLASDPKAKTSHCFVDSTHHTCCKLGPKSRKYSNQSGNPIGYAAEQAAFYLENPLDLNDSKRSWCTCFGSKVCSDYANRFGKDDTFISFIYRPKTYPPQVVVDVPAIPACEETVRKLIAVASHGTPGVNVSFDEFCPPTQNGNIDGEWIEKNTEIYCFKKSHWISKEDYVPGECDF